MVYKKKDKPVQGDEIFNYVDKKFEDARAGRTVWVNKQIKFNKLRMRVKKAKTFPFVGCSNLRMATAETNIRKLKAAIFNVIFGIRPVVTAVPPPGGNYQTSLKIEKFLDHLLMEVMRIQNKCVIGIDQELEQGFYIIKPHWRLEINKRQEKFDLKDLSLEEAYFIYDGMTSEDMIREFIYQKFEIDTNDKIADENEASVQEVIAQVMAGVSEIEFYVQDVIYDFPDISLVAPENLYVPSDSGYDPQSCSCLIHEFFKSYETLKAEAEWKGWDLEGIKAIDSLVDNDTDRLKQQNKDLAEGIERINNPSRLIKLREYYGYYDLNKDGIAEKVVITQAPDFKKTLKKMGLPFDNGKFPFVKIFYELTDDRWYSHRGIPELAEDLIKEIDIQHNMKIDQQTVRNAPMWMYRAGQVNPNLIQLIPNQAIPVNGLQPLTDTLALVNNSNLNVDFSYEKEQMILEGKIQELVGQVDYSLQSMINKRQPRTLGEVELQNQNMQQVFALDAGMHTEQFTELVNMIWDLWCQYGSDEYEFNYFGQNGWEQIKLNKEEIQGKYRISIRGNDRNTNPQVRLQKAQQIMLAAQNPALIQTGVIGPIQQIASLKRFYQYLDIDNWEELINLQWQPPAPPAAATLIKPDFSELPDGEQAQVVASAGIKPDMEGRMLNKRLEIMDMAGTHAKNGTADKK